MWERCGPGVSSLGVAGNRLMPEDYARMRPERPAGSSQATLIHMEDLVFSMETITWYK